MVSFLILLIQIIVHQLMLVPVYFIDVILPVTKGRWSINNELLLSSYKVKGSYTDFKDEDYYSNTDTEFGYSYLKINTLLRYKHPVGNVFLFF